MDYHQVFQVLLEEGPQDAIRFLDPVVKPLQDLPEQSGEQDHAKSSGQEDVDERRFHDQKKDHMPVRPDHKTE